MNERIGRLSVSLGVLLLPIVFSGCSGLHPVPRLDAEVHSSEEAAKFMEESGPSTGVWAEEYVIGPGDRMDVVFAFHSDLSTRGLLVRRDGRITLPYVGDTVAAGLTPMQLDTLLTDSFAEILRDPNIAVIITEPARPRVYVLGQVEKPGGFEIIGEVSVLAAVSMAGGFSTGAHTEHVVLIRRQAGNRIVGIELDMKRVLSGENLQNDLQLRNYDIVYVPQTRLKTVVDFTDAVAGIVSRPMDIALRGWQIASLNANYIFLSAQ